MQVKPNSQFVFILCFAFSLILTSACNYNRQRDRDTRAAGVEKNAPLIQSSMDTSLRLKFTTGIRSLLEDNKGNIWFGSHQEGVARFDGVKFVYYNTEDGLSNNQIRSIYEDKMGVVWFEGGLGISSYDGEQMIEQVEKNYDSSEEWNFLDTDLWFKGDMAVGYNKVEKHPGVYQYDGQKFSYRTFPVTPKEGEENYYSVTTPFVKGKNETLWFGTYGAAIGYHGSDFTIIDNEYIGLNKETGFLHIRSIMEDSKGNLWIGNNGIGVIKYDGEKTIQFTEQQKLTKEDTQGNSLERVFSIGEDKLGNIWFGTVESGCLEI